MTFQPGQSGNPSGRPKAKPFKDALNMEIAAAGENHRLLRRIARKALDAAEDGKMDAITFIADRLDGKVPQAVIGSDDDPPIRTVNRIELVPGSKDDG